jgi:hypothetical protein
VFVYFRTSSRLYQKLESSPGPTVRPGSLTVEAAMPDPYLTPMTMRVLSETDQAVIRTLDMSSAFPDLDLYGDVPHQPTLLFNGEAVSTNPGSQAHDDMCLDRCTGVGVFNGSNNFSHRGAQPSAALRHPSLADLESNLSNRQWYVQQKQPQYRQDPQNQGHFSTPGSMQGIMTTPWMQQPTTFAPDLLEAARRQSYSSSFPVPGNMTPHETFTTEGEGDDASSCDSSCSMTDKCTGVACAENDDVCTDRVCPGPSQEFNPELDTQIAQALVCMNNVQPDSPFDFDFQSPREFPAPECSLTAGTSS